MRRLFGMSCLCLLSLLFLNCPGAPTLGPGGVLVLAPAEVDPALERMLTPLEGTIEKLAGSKPQMQRLTSTTAKALEDAARKAGAGLVLVLDTDTLAPSIFTQSERDQAGEQGFWLRAKDVGTWPNKLNSTGATFVYAFGKSKLAKQYAVYEFLRRLGARFYHPEQEYLPANDPTQLRERAKTPTIIAHKRDSGELYKSDFAYRSYSFHGAHPLEHMEAFSDARHPIKEAVNVNDWIIKNRGNLFRGAGRGVATGDDRNKRVKELDDLRKMLGFPRGAGITLHNEQQGASAVVDRSKNVPPKQQIEDYVTARLKAAPDAYEFGIHFGPTEFTVTPDKETIQWINWAGQKALELNPKIRVIVNNHTSGSQPVDNYDDRGCPSGTNATGKIDYYDLAFHTDKRFGIKVHTVMFYPLEGPAFVYHQKTFAHKLCLMKKASAEGRPLVFFPEGSWWLSFDNTIPVYLPLYILTRGRDIELIKPLLKSRNTGTVDAHRMFNSGHEWGYWQQDYAVGLWHWNADISLQQTIEEMMDPLCDPKDWKAGCAARTEATKVMMELMEHQKEYLMLRKDHRGMPGGLFTYLSGEDPADVIGAATGFVFAPVRVAFAKVAKWNKDQLKTFRESDLKALDEMTKAHKAWLDRLNAIVEQVPEAGRSWLQEVIDGIENNMLRAQQAHQLYSAVLTFRDTQLANEAALKADPNAKTEDPKAKALPLWEAAAKTLKDAEGVIRRREKAYRYPAAQTHGGGLTPDTAVPNGTTYPWRVHTKTHLLTYWTNRHEQVKQILDGATSSNSLNVSPVFDKPGSKLQLQWPPAKGLTAKISVGSDKSVTTDDKEVDLGADEGYWKLEGVLQLDGRDVAVKGGVVRSNILATTPSKGLKLTKPSSPIAQSTLKTLFPALRWAKLTTTPALVFGIDLDKDGKVPFNEVFYAPIPKDGDTFQTDPINFPMPIPDPATNEKIRSLNLSNVVLSGSLKEGKLQSPITMEGKMSVDDLIDALVELAGFEREGAAKTLASILGFDPNNPPKTIDFAAELTIEQPSP